MKVAIVGCGQLAMMLAHAGRNVGVACSFLADADEDARCVSGLGPVVRHDGTKNPEQLYHALGHPDVLTIEREQVDLALLESFRKHCPVYPDPAAVAVTQNRILEKRFLKDFNIPVAPFEVCNNLEELQTHVQDLQAPVYLKHPRLGYDGKQQWKLCSVDQVSDLPLNDESWPLLLEREVRFLCEASLIGVRAVNGETRFYSTTKNTHRDGVLLFSYAGSDLRVFNETMLAVRQYMAALFNFWDYVGVLTMELFLTRNGVVINELAPRVHNSGHWTLDGSACSQFENHLRAITGMPLGDTRMICRSAAMVNLLGIDIVAKHLLTDCNAYLYNKTLRAGRKMGHVNIVHDDTNYVLFRQKQLLEYLYSTSAEISRLA